MQYSNKVAPIMQIDARYHQITRQNKMIIPLKDYKYNKRSSYSRTTQQKLDVVEISVQGLNALKQHEQSTPPTQNDTANISYIANLIANYGK